ncbi:potassium channel family protein [Methanocella sp. MCL-LM]|uniref:potassium channel family protein n=1 Tax=Methanocella sp. MCL-LM TaxID=3412035 RepID=UPI003C773E49
MSLKAIRSHVRSALASPYVLYPAGILAVTLIYTLLFMELADNFNVGEADFLTALYWVVISMTTTGYGDIYPVTALGHIFSMIVILTGLLILFAIVLPLMVNPIIEQWFKNPRKRLPDWLTDHVIICGHNTMVEVLIGELTRKGLPLVVVDQSAEIVRDLQWHGYSALQGDSSDESLLHEARIKNAKYIIANEGDDKNAALVLTASQISESSIIAVVESLDMTSYMEYAGADIVVSPKQVLGMNLGLAALSSINFEISGAVDLGGDVKMCKLPVYPDNPLVGKKLDDARIREKAGATVVAILKNGEFIVDPPPSEVIDEATVLVVAGTGDQIRVTGTIAGVKHPACATSCIIAGFGDVGREVARRLDDKGVPYTVIDRRQYDLKDQVVGDATSKESLIKAGIHTTSTIVVTLNDDARNMLTILLARNLNPHINIIARANTSSSVGKMYRAGADYVMSLSAVGGQILARIVEKGSFKDTVLLSDNVLLARFFVAGSKLENRTIAESGMRTRTGCTIIGIREGDRFRPNPGPSERLNPESVLIVVGTASQLEDCQTEYGLKRPE